jgi:hypothetical protein
VDRSADLADDVWVHPGVEVRRSSVAGDGVFSTARLDAGVVVIRLGGRLVSTAELHHLFTTAADDAYIDTVAVGVDTRFTCVRTEQAIAPAAASNPRRDRTKVRDE